MITRLFLRRTLFSRIAYMFRSRDCVRDCVRLYFIFYSDPGISQAFFVVVLFGTHFRDSTGLFRGGGNSSPGRVHREGQNDIFGNNPPPRVGAPSLPRPQLTNPPPFQRLMLKLSYVPPPHRGVRLSLYPSTDIF